MALDIKTREAGGVTVLDLKGRIVLGEATSALRGRIKELVADNKFKLVLNLADVSFIDSTGVGTLVSGYTSIKAAGGELKLASLTRKFQEVLQVTRLLTVFETFASDTDAVASFK
ncbi:MAG: STAS domain-containing protein [Terriglobia bacterium]